MNHPKLRPIDVQVMEHAGELALFLRDPLALSTHSVAVPQMLGPVLTLLDGAHSVDAVREALRREHGMLIAAEPVERLVAALDEVYLLDNERSARAAADALTAFRAADARQSFLAGATYPAELDALRRLLDGFLDAATDQPEADGTARRGLAADPPRVAEPTVPLPRGIISPHIDYARGGPAYARTWRRAADVARAADLVVILGTDHFGPAGQLTLTRQSYATPYGRLPTDAGVVERLIGTLGEEATLAGELHHRTEHSIELSAVWLQHMRDGEPVEIVPVLCGSFAPLIEGVSEPDGGCPVFDRFADVFAEATDGRRVLVVASADLSHVGPAFGGEPVDEGGRARLEIADRRLMAPVLAGDADAFLDVVRSTGDATNVCGVPPIYTALRLLGPTRGEMVTYDLCPADTEDTSVVSVCGALLS